VRICLAYDCLYPWTVGGAERWYRGLADELVGAGHELTYLTRRQWDADDAPRIAGVRVLAVSPREPLYGPAGTRRTGPPVRFGLGVARHLLRHRHRYDAVHLCAFPYFPLLGARAALARAGVPITVDWFEVWSRPYWLAYSGPLAGLVGWLVQRACVRATPRAFVFSALHERRLREEGLRAPVTRLAGLYAGPRAAALTPAGEPPTVVFAGRHIPEKRAELVPVAVAAARERVPGLRGIVFGDGPRRDAVLAAIAAVGAEAFVTAPGFVDAEEVRDALASAACHVLPSVREGYGLVVVEAAVTGTPSVVVREPDNAAAELVRDGVNGRVAASPAGLADAIVAVIEGGDALRRSTAAWFAGHADALSVARSARRIAAALAP